MIINGVAIPREAALELLRAAKAYLEVIHGDMSPEAVALRAAIAAAEPKQDHREVGRE